MRCSAPLHEMLTDWSSPCSLTRTEMRPEEKVTSCALISGADGGGELAHRVGVERKTVEIAVARLIAACAAVQNGLVAEVNERRGIDELLARGVDTVAIRVADLAAGEVDGEGVFWMLP